MSSSAKPAGAKGLGTEAVFLTAISTILGAVMFLRFGFAVGNVGLLGTLAIVVLGHMVTVPTALAIAEIATNQRVAGGGAYHIISRSFGVVIGGAIGISLYLSQAISVAFYVIAFAECFRPLLDLMGRELAVADPRFISLPCTILLALLMLWKGADLGVKTLYLVVAALFISLTMFFTGQTDHEPGTWNEAWTATVDEPASFFYVFAIVFPAFTGVAAGLGLSGDLRNPKRAIPVGTLAATATGMVVYLALAWKLAVSASPDDLAQDQFIMSRIALWGPIIPIGLACATFSSALGSILVAPRTLQALAADGLFPTHRINNWLSHSAPRNGEPSHAAAVTTVVALFFVCLGNVDFVAQIISMFFMVTYGAICLISFIEHFAADPTYRPGFRSRWYVSLFGAIACLWLMFEMSAPYATLAIVCMLGIYALLARFNPERRGLSNMFQGAVFQFSRQLQIVAQKSRAQSNETWRPSVVAISRRSFDDFDAFELLRWISFRYGFGTYIHHLEGYFSKATVDAAERDLHRLVARANVSGSNVFVDTIVCPSATSLIAQVIQLPGVSGKANNMILFEHPRDSSDIGDLVDNYQLITAAGFDVAILATSRRGFGYRREIHLWLTQADIENSGLMIMLAYIILGHPDWRRAKIKMFALTAESAIAEEEERLATLIREGRMPIARSNLEVVSQGSASKSELVNMLSADADLVILGFRGELLKRRGPELLEGYTATGNMLFINTTKEIDLDRKDEVVVEPDEVRRIPGQSVERAVKAMREVEAQTSERISASPDHGR